jgi:hypothetical protein
MKVVVGKVSDIDDQFSDYPHWDFDSPAKALPAAMPAQMRSKVMGENAARLYAKRLSRG